MKTLILAAGRFGESMKQGIAAGREPRLDVFELGKVLDADVLDYLAVDASALALARRAGAFDAHGQGSSRTAPRAALVAIAA